MSTVVTLQEAKEYLGTIGNAEDSNIQLLLDAAEDEALQFLDRDDLLEWDSEISSEDPVPSSVKLGVLILLQAAYQAAPEEAQELRRVAETKLMPYRLNLGV